MILTHLTEWLLDDSVDRCILVEVNAFNGVEEVILRLSNKNYVTGVSDTPPNTSYLPCITSVAPLTEQLGLDGKARLSLGEISFSNHEGDLDDWLDWVFDNRDISVFIGDVNWPRGQFELIYKGIVEPLQIKSNEEFTLPVTDSLQKLNGALNDDLDDDDETLPMTFGEVSNVKQKLIDPVNLVYQVHTRGIGGIIEVRDRGIPVLFAANLQAGTFQLAAKPFGEITCSVWGDAVGGYSDEIIPLIARITSNFGPEPLSPSEIDTAALNATASINSQTVGVYLDERANLLEVISSLAFSIGAAVCTTALGRLKVIQIIDPNTATPVISLSGDNMAENTFRVRSKLDVLTSFKLGYNRNYSQGSDLSPGLPTEHAKEFESEWKFVKVADETLRSRYRHTKEPLTEYSHLQVRSEALAEAVRWFDIFKTQRYVFSFDGFEECLQLELGDVIEIHHPKFGFSTGKSAMVIGLSKNWNTGKVGVEVFA